MRHTNLPKPNAIVTDEVETVRKPAGRPADTLPRARARPGNVLGCAYAVGLAAVLEGVL